MNFLRYNTAGQGYYSDQYLKLDPRCNGWTAINRGAGVAFVNGIPLSPPSVVGEGGESITIGGNIGELWGGELQLSFAPGAASNEVVIIQKFYLP